MTRRIPDSLLSRFSEFVAEYMGLYFPEARWSELERGLDTAAGELGFQDAASCIQRLLAAPLNAPQIEILASHLTVGETYFFREQRSFEALEKHVLPERIGAHRGGEQRLRIWSAGCCTGEEPYSIAILLSRMIDLQDWNVSILGTDINPRFLRKAAEGVYKEWSFRDTPDWVREEYFTNAAAGGLEVLPRIKEMVRFAYLNLAEDEYPSLQNNTNAMDVIFCRNVLMYFVPQRAQRVVRRFNRALVDGGWLIVSPTEASQTLFSEFASIYFPGAVFYQKDRRQIRPAKAFEFTAPVAVPWFPVDPVSAVPPETAPDIHPREFEPAPAGLLDEEPEPVPAVEAEETLYEKALALYEQGHYAEAAESLVALLSLDPTGGDGVLPDGKAIVLLVQACANAGEFAEARRWCETAMVGDKLNPVYPYLRATLLQEQDRLEEAAAALRQALYLDADFVMAHFSLGNLRLRQGKVRGAKKHLENALGLLAAYEPEETLPQAESLTAGRLSEVISSTSQEVSS